MKKFMKGVMNFGTSLLLMSGVVLALYKKDVWPRGTARMQTA